jgi:hypothetical protein
MAWRAFTRSTSFLPSPPQLSPQLKTLLWLGVWLIFLIIFHLSSSGILDSGHAASLGKLLQNRLDYALTDFTISKPTDISAFMVTNYMDSIVGVANKGITWTADPTGIVMVDEYNVLQSLTISTLDSSDSTIKSSAIQVSTIALVTAGVASAAYSSFTLSMRKFRADIWVLNSNYGTSARGRFQVEFNDDLTISTVTTDGQGFDASAIDTTKQIVVAVFLVLFSLTVIVKEFDNKAIKSYGFWVFTFSLFTTFSVFFKMYYLYKVNTKISSTVNGTLGSSVDWSAFNGKSVYQVIDVIVSMLFIAKGLHVFCRKWVKKVFQRMFVVMLLYVYVLLILGLTLKFNGGYANGLAKLVDSATNRSTIDSVGVSSAETFTYLLYWFSTVIFTVVSFNIFYQAIPKRNSSDGVFGGSNEEDEEEEDYEEDEDEAEVRRALDYVKFQGRRTFGSESSLARFFSKILAFLHSTRKKLTPAFFHKLTVQHQRTMASASEVRIYSDEETKQSIEIVAGRTLRRMGTLEEQVASAMKEFHEKLERLRETTKIIKQDLRKIR